MIKTDEEVWQEYTTHEGKWSTKGAFFAALSIGRQQGREESAKIADITMDHLASPIAPYNHGVLDTKTAIAKAIRAI